jgi:hypothetical protein
MSVSAVSSHLVVLIAINILTLQSALAYITNLDKRYIHIVISDVKNENMQWYDIQS